MLRFKEQGDGGVILNTGSVAGLVGWGGTVYGATKGAVHQLTRAVAVEAAPFGIRVNAICPAGMPYTNFMAAGGMDTSSADLEQIAQHTGSMHPLGRPITAEDCAEAAVYLCSDRAAQRHRRPAPDRRGVRRPMTDTQDSSIWIGSASSSTWPAASTPQSAGHYRGRPVPVWHALREQAAVHEGTVHELSGLHADLMLPRAAVPGSTSLLGLHLGGVRRRLPRTRSMFASSPDAVDLEDGELGPTNSMLSMGGDTASSLPGRWSSRRSRPRRRRGGSRTGSKTPSTP